jgi:hypothetical protein
MKNYAPTNLEDNNISGMEYDSDRLTPQAIKIQSLQRYYGDNKNNINVYSLRR